MTYRNIFSSLNEELRERRKDMITIAILGILGSSAVMLFKGVTIIVGLYYVLKMFRKP